MLTINSDIELKQEIARGLKKIKPYNGTSSIWFSYQAGLDIGAGILRTAVGLAPKSPESTKVLWDTVLKISKKLSHGGVDDSNGTVWPICDEIVQKLLSWQDDPIIKKLLVKYAKDETGFDFEGPLKNLNLT